MQSIGIRVSPKVIYYCISFDQPEPTVTVDTLIIPNALTVPQKLAFTRTTVQSIIAEFHVTRAGIRVYEGNVQHMNRFRMNLEGVIQELLANSSVEKHFTGTKSTIGKLLSLRSNELSSCVEGRTSIPDYSIENWDSGFKQEERESVVTSIAASKL